MKFVSFVLHPLLLASYVMLIFYFYLPEFFSPVASNSIPTLILATFITTFIIPVLSILIMKMTSRISNLELTNREERIMPFISIALFYAAATYMYMTKLQISPPLSIMMVSVTALIILLLLITFRFKISIHATAIWGCSGLLVGTSLKLTGTTLLVPLAILFVLSGLVSSSRLHLGYHTPQEIWTGSIFGFFFCLGSVLIFG
jgi:hypothetical protein